MTLQLFGHPFSSYTWKALIAFYETDTPFEFRILSPDEPENTLAMTAHWPVGKFPMLIDDGVAIIEAGIIVEHVAPSLIPADRGTAREVRMLDRIFDNYVMTPMQAFVANALKPETRRDIVLVDEARAMLDQSYTWLDARLVGRTWAAGEAFTLADCAAAGALFYADWVHPIAEGFGALKAYRARLLARPSVARCVEDARPFRHYFPLGAPDRD